MPRSKRNAKPRRMSLVRFKAESLPSHFLKKYPFKAGRTYVYLGELVNMGGHCVVADHKTGRLYSGFHTENFVEIPADEV